MTQTSDTQANCMWRMLNQVAPRHAHFAMRRVNDPTQIFSVFHELFAKSRARAG